jgi:hypothetical protein
LERVGQCDHDWRARRAFETRERGQLSGLC